MLGQGEAVIGIRPPADAAQRLRPQAVALALQGLQISQHLLAGTLGGQHLLQRLQRLVQFAIGLLQAAESGLRLVTGLAIALGGLPARREVALPQQLALDPVQRLQLQDAGALVVDHPELAQVVVADRPGGVAEWQKEQQRQQLELAGETEPFQSVHTRQQQGIHRRTPESDETAKRLVQQMPRQAPAASRLCARYRKPRRLHELNDRSIAPSVQKGAMRACRDHSADGSLPWRRLLLSAWKPCSSSASSCEALLTLARTNCGTAARPTAKASAVATR